MARGESPMSHQDMCRGSYPRSRPWVARTAMCRPSKSLWTPKPGGLDLQVDRHSRSLTVSSWCCDLAA